MDKEYIGSQEHFEDEINAYYDQKELIEKEIESGHNPDWGRVFSEPVKEVKSAEEILRNKFYNNFLDFDYIDLCVEAMEEYTSQFRNEREVTDEEIEKHVATIDTPNHDWCTFTYDQGYIAGAIAMRDGKIKSTN